MIKTHLVPLRRKQARAQDGDDHFSEEPHLFDRVECCSLDKPESDSTTDQDDLRRKRSPE